MVEVLRVSVHENGKSYLVVILMMVGVLTVVVIILISVKN